MRNIKSVVDPLDLWMPWWYDATCARFYGCSGIATTRGRTHYPKVLKACHPLKLHRSAATRTRR